ncbi:MAG: heparinase, partial [Armatimonadetes bacterium]|nr:heparinase [Armatimonadota bacterium]
MSDLDLPIESAARPHALGPVSRASLYVNTIRHLRACQVLGRGFRAVQRQSPDLRPAPQIREPDDPCLPPARHEPSMVGPELMRMLNETRSIEGAAAWSSPECSRLWLYNLHYFDDLVAADAPKRQAWHQALMSRWIAENPPGVGVGWEPYPVSLRIVNWVKWALHGSPVSEECIQSLAVQARWLRGHVERHLLGNHLMANAKALIFAGAFFRGAEAEGWLRDGIEIVRTELDEQILSDGGHFERSPMYHSIILEDLLDLLNLRCAFGHRLGVHYGLFSSKVSAHVPKMLSWLVAMCHPDGEIGLFNDAAMGIAASPAEG